MHKDNPYASKQPDFAALGQTYAKLRPYLIFPRGPDYATIDFQDAKSLRALTESLLKHDFDLDVDLPADRLCPTIANRLDYILHLLALCCAIDPAISSAGDGLKVLDIGTGAVAIYPILLSRLRPKARIIATELDASSCRLAEETVKRNGLDRILVQKSVEGDKILQPLFNADVGKAPFTFTMCNPPFFGSAEEMTVGSALKDEGAPAAPTAAQNELITPGGEVLFVGQMMDESAELQERCAWYTSLLGKASSIGPLVARLKSLKINNYILLSIRQAQTTRWIIAWSFTAVRLPDALTREPSRSIFRYLPPPNSFSWHRDEGVSASALQEALDSVLRDELRLPVDEADSLAKKDKPLLNRVDEVYVFRPTEAMWTRAYRRATARGQAALTPSATRDPLFEARIYVQEEGANATLHLDWTYGRDRQPVEGFWTFLTGKLGTKLRAASDDADRPSKKAKASDDA